MGFCTVTLRHKGREQHYQLRRGLSLQALAAKHDTPLEFDCRASDCGICVIKVLQGAENLSPCKAGEQDFLTAMHADGDERLACQCRVNGNIAIEVEEL